MVRALAAQGESVVAPLVAYADRGDAAALAKAGEGLKGRFKDAMDDDFNTAGALGHLFEAIRELNRFMDAKPSGAAARDAVEGLLADIKEIGAVLRLFDREPSMWQSSLLERKVEGMGTSEIQAAIEKRNQARADKDWAESDRIRDELAERGVLLEDKPGGVTAWRVKL